MKLTRAEKIHLAQLLCDDVLMRGTVLKGKIPITNLSIKLLAKLLPDLDLKPMQISPRRKKSG